MEIIKNIQANKNKLYQEIKFLAQSNPQEAYEVLEEYLDFINCEKKNLYHLLANVCQQLSRVDDAIFYYEMAIQSNPNDFLAYHRLANFYLINKKYSLAIPLYKKSLELNSEHDWANCNLGIALLNDGNYQEAIPFLYKAITINPKMTLCRPLLLEVINKLWQSINKFDTGNIISNEINDINNCFLQELLAETSIYHQFFIANVGEENLKHIKREGLSLEYLRFIQGNFGIETQKSYIKNLEGDSCSINISEKLFFSNQSIHKVATNSGNILAETGYVYVTCPYTRKIIKSNKSFMCISTSVHSESSHIIYRFASQKVFYLIFGTAFQSVLGLYFPSTEMFIYVYGTKNEHVQRFHIKGILDQLKVFCLKNWDQVSSYLNDNLPKERALITGINKNFGHSYWNDLTGLESLVTSGLMENVSKILVGPYNTMDPCVLFPSIPESKVKRFPTEEDLQNAIIEDNYVVFRPVDFFITQDLVNSIKKGSANKVNSDFANQVSIAKDNFYPLLWITLRSESSKRPVWKSQIEGIVSIVNKIYKEYPLMGIIFDGWSNLSFLNDKDHLMITKENTIREKIESLLPNTIKTYNLIGATPYEKIVFSEVATTYLIPFGSSLTIMSWIADKEGVSHENHGVLKMPWRYLYEAGFRENMTSSSKVIPIELVKQLSDGYELDIEWVSNSLLEIIKKNLNNR